MEPKTTPLPDAIREKIAEWFWGYSGCEKDREIAEIGARIVLDRLAATAEKDKEAAFKSATVDREYIRGRESVRNEVVK